MIVFDFIFGGLLFIDYFKFKYINTRRNKKNIYIHIIYTKLYIKEDCDCEKKIYRKSLVRLDCHSS